MKFLFDLLPIIVFVAGYSSGLSFPEYGINKPIEFATALTMAAALAQVAWLKLRGKPVETMQWVSLGLIVVFGGATLLLHNPNFIFWKTSALDVALAGGMLISRYVMKKPPLALLMGKELDLPTRTWDTLMWAWVLFFLFMAVLNLWVAYVLGEAIWVKFKLIGGLGLPFVFAICQGIWLMRQIPAGDGPKKET
ncbi:septation protein A [Chitinimonas arctica]|uniref:Inner membrane-spanning protein YciB n=1 Tax=Chitinimonas arctica TaxID=2594795 RepID=A0A516SKN4_9NEIS|nr:septation protein A [Chitinimonas arctica]QDQ28683.1 septation protein A [Chitinimonas arctica]